MEVIRNQITLALTSIVFSKSPNAEDIAFLCRAMERVRTSLGHFPMADLGDLVPLPNRAAHRLAKAISVLEGLAKKIQHETDGTKWFEYTTNRRFDFLKIWSERLNRGIEFLNVSISELNKAADSGAPTQTHEELHGDCE